MAVIFIKACEIISLVIVIHSHLDDFVIPRRENKFSYNESLMLIFNNGIIIYKVIDTFVVSNPIPVSSEARCNKTED